RPADVENIERDVMALADLTNHVVDWDRCILEHECACRGALESHLVFFSAGRDPRIVFLDDETTELFTIHLRKGDEHIGKCGYRYPHLFAIDDPMRAISAANRICFGGQRVGTAAGFRECISRDLLRFTLLR